MNVVLLCGGKGMRLQEQTATLPKPLIEIGGRPVLWHVMKWYAHHGIRDFILCLGYLGNRIKDYFLHDDSWRYDNFVLRMAEDEGSRIEPLGEPAAWNIVFAETGLETPTGGRVHRVADLVDGDLFLVNYSDGLADLDLPALISFHQAHGKIATLTAVRPRSPFGVLALDDGRVLEFQEKPQTDTWINGGFFVFNRKIFDYLNPQSILESDALTQLATCGELMAFQHTGRWECMDTYKETAHLNQLWENGEAFWKVW